MFLRLEMIAQERKANTLMWNQGSNYHDSLGYLWPGTSYVVVSVVTYAKRRDYLLLIMTAPSYKLSDHFILVSAGMNYVNNTTDF